MNETKLSLAFLQHTGLPLPGYCQRRLLALEQLNGVYGPYPTIAEIYFSTGKVKCSLSRYKLRGILFFPFFLS